MFCVVNVNTCINSYVLMLIKSNAQPFTSFGVINL